MKDKIDYTSWPAFKTLDKPNMPQVSFIKKIVPAIIKTSDKGILNSIRMAQAILESGWGTSVLARNANNLFGIKSDTRWHGNSYSIMTNEWNKDKGMYKTMAKFRLYTNVEDCIKDHSNFLLAPRYSSIINDQDYKSVANKLREAGYATDPKYPSKLINVIESNSLTWFDTFTVFGNRNHPRFKVGDEVTIKPNSVWMTEPAKLVPTWAQRRSFVIDVLEGNRAILDRKGINSPINTDNLVLVR